MEKLSHIDSDGKASMVDVGHKPMQQREAKAKGFISLNKDTVLLIRENEMKKGDVLTTAEIAGIQGGKGVRAELKDNGVEVFSTARCVGQTGIEMEALTAVSIALLTVYDMCKAVDKSMEISSVVLVEKTKKDIL